MLHNKGVKVIAVGDYDFVLPFKTIGIETMVIETKERQKLIELFEHLVRKKYHIAFVIEEIVELLQEDIEVINKEEELAIIPIPGVLGSKGLGIKTIEESVEKAVGINIFAVR